MARLVFDSGPDVRLGHRVCVYSCSCYRVFDSVHAADQPDRRNWGAWRSSSSSAASQRVPSRVGRSVFPVRRSAPVVCRSALAAGRFAPADARFVRPPCPTHAVAALPHGADFRRCRMLASEMGSSLPNIYCRKCFVSCRALSTKRCNLEATGGLNCYDYSASHPSRTPGPQPGSEGSPPRRS